jgi:hypothetical protein
MSNTTTDHPAHHGFVPGLSLWPVDDDRVARGNLPVQEQDAQNKQLIELSNQILELTRLIHAHTQATQSVKQ